MLAPPLIDHDGPVEVVFSSASSGRFRRGGVAMSLDLPTFTTSVIAVEVSTFMAGVVMDLGDNAGGAWLLASWALVAIMFGKVVQPEQGRRGVELRGGYGDDPACSSVCSVGLGFRLCCCCCCS